MKKILAKIDMALKHMNALSSPHRAHDFLVSRQTPANQKVANRDYHGALLVRNVHAKEVSLGIFLSEGVLEELKTFSRWKPMQWTTAQYQAFGVAAEEISHFHYLLFRAHRNESVSRLELEIQGEVDRFFLAYFANLRGQKDDGAEFFDLLHQRLFQHFSLVAGLSGEERARYWKANHTAKRFVKNCRRWVEGQTSFDPLLETVRKFYRAGGADKKGS